MTSSGEAYLGLVKGIAQTFETHRILYAFSGALANALWGIPRATKDLDLLVHVPRIALPTTIELLFGLGCQGSLEEVLKTSLDEHVIRLDYQGMDVEVFLPFLPYHHEVLRRRVQHPIEDVPAYFVSAEDLVILKFLFHRAKDVADIQAILATQADRLDRAYLTSTLRSVLPAEDPRHRELAQWLPPPRTQSTS